jgi:toxin-antitoxin system PIN domain toxin
MHLLDINVLIALVDPDHLHHAGASSWFHSIERDAWATCPLTENGFIRILSQPSYPTFSGNSENARRTLNALTSNPGHQFWPDSVSLRDSQTFPRLSGVKNLTDLYLLALAVSHKGKFATLDARISPDLIPGGPQAYFFVPELKQ